MGILDRINQRNTEAQLTGKQQVADQAAEDGGPDAVQTAKGDRQRHQQAYAQMQGPNDDQIIDEPAGAEEQAVHEKLERQMIEMISSQNDGATEALLKAVFSNEDPVHGIGTVASDIVQNLKQANPDATQEVLLSIGERTVEELVELVEMANPRVDLSEDDMGEALSIGIEQFNQMNSSEIDDDEMRSYLANG
jgi:hypothetical protein